MTEVIRLSEQTLGRFALCDARLVAIEWHEGGRDLALRLVAGDRRPTRMTCTWVSALHVDLRYGRCAGGHALSSECGFERRGRRWHVSFGFPPQGVIELECAEAHLEFAAAPSE